MSFHYSPRIATDGLALYLDAANSRSFSSGAPFWKDMTSANHLGTYSGTSFSASNGGCIAFNGVGDYVNLGSAPDLDIFTFTVIAWAKSNTFSDYQNIVFKGTYGLAQYGLHLNASGDWAVQPNEGVGFIGDPVQLNTWNCFAGTYDGAQVRGYRNGVLKAQYSISQGHFGTSTTIGADIPNNRYFNGSIANVKIYSRPLSDKEILQDFNALKGRFGF